MTSAGSAVSESRTAPSTDCSASRFCGGATAPGAPAPSCPPLKRRVCPLVRSGTVIGRPSLGPGPVAPPGVPAPCDRFVAGLDEGVTGLLLLDDHRLDGRRDAGRDLDLDHARADRLDRLVAVVDANAARLLDGVDDVLRGDRAEEPAVVASLVRDGEDGLVEQGRVLLRAGRRLGDRAVGGLAA